MPLAAFSVFNKLLLAYLFSVLAFAATCSNSHSKQESSVLHSSWLDQEKDFAIPPPVNFPNIKEMRKKVGNMLTIFLF